MSLRNLKQLSPGQLLSLTQSPGAQYLVADAEKILSECYAGFADISNETPVTSSTTFNAFSITKTVTAATALKLVEQNKISLSDLVNDILNEFHFEYPFTVQQLLSHQAGFTDPIPISWIHLMKEESSFDEKQFIINLLSKHSKQKFKPGTKFKYSSMGYLALSLLIEKVSGNQYKDFVSKNVLPSLGNDAALNFESDEAKHATGYHPRYSFSNLLLSFFLDKKKFVRGNYGLWIAFNNFYVNGKAYGGLIGNVRGLAAYLQSYLSEKMFQHREIQELMFKEQMGGMGLAWFTGKLNGNKYVCHAGGGGGYYCEIRIYPELKLATTLLRNKGSFGDLRLLDKIDARTIF